MNDEMKNILNKFDKKLESYELDKKFGQLSIDSICHLFPNEITTIKDYITNLQKENERLNNIIDELENMLENEIDYMEHMNCEVRDDNMYKMINLIRELKEGKDLLNILNGGDLNDEVEIIEDGNKIEKIERLEYSTNFNKEEFILYKNILAVNYNLNDVIDEINKLKEDK